jgi:hypothetical protein
VRRVLTRDQLNRLLRARWLFAVVVLALVLGTIVVTQHGRVALAADTRGATEIVSVDTAEAQGTAISDEPAISANGRFIAFTTLQGFDNLDKGNDGSNQEKDIYVRDTVAGTTTYISRGHTDGPDEASKGPSSDPYMSADGRYVGFVSAAVNIVNSTSDTAVICDRGAPDGAGAFGPSCQYTNLGSSSDSAPKISADGSRAAYLHNSQAVVVDLTINPGTGVISAPPPTAFTHPARPATLTIGGVVMIPDFDKEFALSADGRWLVRVTRYFSDNDDATFGITRDVVLLNDLKVPNDPEHNTPAVRFDFASPTAFVDTAVSSLAEPAISGDGRRIAFTEQANSPTAEPPMVVHGIDRDPDGNGAFGPTTGPGAQAITADKVSRNAANGIVAAREAAFSTDGRYLAFVTDALNVHNGVDNGDQDFTCVHVQPPVINAFTRPLQDGPRMRLAASIPISNCDVVVRDLVQDAARLAAGLPRLPAELASPSQRSSIPSTSPTIVCTTVCEGNDDSDAPVLTADGSAVAFASKADNLLTGADTNGRVSDVFKRTFRPVPVVAPLNFGDVVVNTDASGTAQVTYPSDAGFGPLLITAIAIGGPQGGDFAVFPGQTCTGQVLHPGDTCAVSIRFHPAAVGTRTATLTLTTSTGVAGVGRLSGNGVPAPPPKTPVFQAAPNPLAFGTRPLFAPSAPQTVTVTNTGTAPLTITNVTPVGSAPTNFPGDYQITANTCVGTPVLPGLTCTVSVTFAPQAVGSRPALLQFTDNATPGPQLVGLTGAGGPPTLVALPPLAPPGGVSQVTGTGFPPGKVVVLTLDGMPQALNQPTASGSGTFTWPLVILPHTSHGNRQLHATVQGVPNPIVVSIDFLVVPGSLQPPDFAERR